MKKRGWVIILIFLAILILGLYQPLFTGKVGYEPGDEEMQPETIGPPPEELECMETCVAKGCSPGDEACANSNAQKCLVECNAGPPTDVSEEELCMQDCVVIGCSERDFECQERNKAKCEKDCGMITEPEAQSEEEQCIRDCVAEHDPNLRCSASQEGETGNEICQMCSDRCVHLYEGPCLTDEQLTQKENQCTSKCEHCYGETVMGPSGQGWDCIVDVKCMDATGEFGDNPGEGPGIDSEENEKIVTNFFESVGNFFKGIFG